MMNCERRRALLQRRKNASEKLSLEELKKIEMEIVIGETQLCSFCGRLDHNFEACERRRQAVEELEKERAAMEKMLKKDEEKAGKRQESEAEAWMIPIMIGNTELCSFCGRLDHNYKDCARRLEAVEELEKKREREKPLALPENSICARLAEHLRDIQITLK